MDSSNLPLVYACSGCSNVAQLANRLAVELNRLGRAEMSCISGVGGDVKPLVRKAKNAEQIIAIDGCPLACVKNCLARHDVEASHYFELTSTGHKKRYHAQCDDDEFFNAMAMIENSIAR